MRRDLKSMSAKTILRPYQERALLETFNQLAVDRRVLLVAPTGAGKTVIAATLIQRAPRLHHVLWLAHRTELIGQAREHLTRLGLRCGVRCGKYIEQHPDHVDEEATHQIGSVQTIHRQGPLAVVPDLIVFDEAHHSMADSYQDIAKLAPDALMLGLTATPCRMDGRGLGNFYRSMRVVVTSSELYSEGYLRSPLTYIEDEDQIVESLRGAKTAAGDFTRASMSRAVDRVDLIGNVVRQALRLAPIVPKVVFAATIAHSRRIAERFRNEGVAAEHLDAHTPTAERARVIEALGTGKLEVVTNVDLFCEGWDLPGLGAVSLARPTKSFARLVQMIGRVQRPEGPTAKIVLDHGANCTRLQHFPGEDVAWTLEQGAPPRPAAETEVWVKACVACRLVIEWSCGECPQCGAKQPATRAPREILREREADLIKLERARFEKQREALRARAQKVARTRGLDDNWVERVVAGELPRPP
jgi:superfamily II DNA or RNA helicase